MKNKTLIITGLLVLQTIPLKAWVACKNFFDYYHFSLYDLELQLIYAVNHDQGIPVVIARIFHNKLLQFAIDVYKRYTHFLDWQLLITLISFVGVFGFIIAIWYFIESKKRNKKLGILILISLGIPLVEVIVNFPVAFYIKLGLVVLPFHAVAVFGHFQFLSSKNKKTVFLVYFVLILLSITWTLLVPEQAHKYCELP